MVGGGNYQVTWVIQQSQLIFIIFVITVTYSTSKNKLYHTMRKLLKKYHTWSSLFIQIKLVFEIIGIVYLHLITF
jgi:hypothetical protein